VPPVLRTPRTRLIRREQAVAALVAVVPAHAERLVTVAGIGGSGRTRLALAVAGALQEMFPNGVWLSELGSLADPAYVALGVATARGVPDVAGMPLIDRRKAALRPRTLLLALDNGEHLIAACCRFRRGGPGAGAAQRLRQTGPSVCRSSACREAAPPSSAPASRFPSAAWRGRR
jgi:hypothetical protein